MPRVGAIRYSRRQRLAIRSDTQQMPVYALLVAKMEPTQRSDETKGYGRAAVRIETHSQKGLVEVIVIAGIERPSEN